MKSWTSVSIGVENLGEVLDLWSGTFGLEIRAQKNGEDPELAGLWGLSPGDISRQAILGTPNVDSGLIHFVEFNNPGPAFRQGAQVFDLCPKNLDIYARDLPARVDELRSAGMEFRTDKYSEVTAPDGTAFREIHMHGHDAINIVLLEVIGLDLPFTQQGYAGIGPVVTIVKSAAEERLFYKNIINLDLLNDNVLEGPEIEQMIGLPPGSALDVTIWGGQAEAFGQMEVIDYRGVDGNDLYPNAVPRQRGILHVSYKTHDLSKLTMLLDRADIPWSGGDEVSILPGQGRFIRFHSPTGFQLEVFEPMPEPN